MMINALTEFWFEGSEFCSDEAKCVEKNEDREVSKLPSVDRSMRTYHGE